MRPNTPQRQLIRTVVPGIGWVILWLAWLPSLAQLDQTLRREFLPRKEGQEDTYEVTPVGGNGVLVSVRSDEAFGRPQKTWNFSRYDTTFQEVWSKDFLINSLLLPLKSYHNGQYLYVLFSEPESLDISVFRLDIETGEGEMIEGTLIAGIEVSDFKVLENQAYVVGVVKNRPVVVAFSLFDRRPRILPGLYLPNSEINNLWINEANRTVSVMLYTNVRNACQLTVKTYGYDSKLLDEVTFQNEKDISLVTGNISALGESSRLLMGNYSLDCTPYSQGMYLAKFNGNQQEFIRYFKFADFKNFFNYMKPARQERVKTRILRKREKGKELRLRYRLLTHDIIETPGGFVLVAEAYYPQYRSSSSGGYYGRSLYNDRVFDGYRFTHAVVCGFDKQGNLLWDNSFEILDFVSYDLQPVVQVNVENDRVVLAYPQEGTINTKVIKGNTILKSKENYKILTNYEHDKVTDSEPAHVAHWYGAYFLAWGFQEINNGRDSGVTRERDVFYLNKVTYLNGEEKQGNSQVNPNPARN